MHCTFGLATLTTIANAPRIDDRLGWTTKGGFRVSPLKRSGTSCCESSEGTPLMPS
jgi:hypothetical protein